MKRTSKRSKPKFSLSVPPSCCTAVNRASIAALRDGARQNSFRGRPQWQLEIIHRYPSVYLSASAQNLQLYAENPERIDTLAFCNLRYGFECDQGWSSLIDDLSSMAVTLVEKIRSSGLQPSAAITACIVKEKFGKLSWQGHCNLKEPFRSQWFAYARLIESRSVVICERCGKPGQTREVANWFTTLCDAGYQEKLKRTDLA